MKESRSSLLEQVSDLSKDQWFYKPASNKKNIEEHISHVAISENKLWSLLEQAMKAPSSPSRRAEVALEDEELIRFAENHSMPDIACDLFSDPAARYSSFSQALEEFKKQRLEHIRYLRTSTEDLRNHVVSVSFGTIDCYQLCLLIAAHAEKHYQDILQIKAAPSFPE